MEEKVKKVYKMISRNMRNCDEELVKILTSMQNTMQWRDLIYEAMKNRNCLNKKFVARCGTSC
jgi:D-ribose pyranose/furanose isomerase RbsD